MEIVYINKKFVPFKKAGIPIFDRGFLYGDGAFETMRSYRGVIFGFDKHAGRLFKTLKILGINPPVKTGTLKRSAYGLLDKNKLARGSEKDAYLKIIITRGAWNGLALERAIAPNLMIYGHEIKNEKRNKNITLLPAPVKNSSLSGLKTLNYLENILCLFEAKRKGYDDALMIGENGIVKEATTSNIFFIKDQVLYTPGLKSGILPGIIREEVIKIAKNILRLKLQEKFIKTSDINLFEGAFLTNSISGLTPVSRIGRKKFKRKNETLIKDITREFKAIIDRETHL